MAVQDTLVQALLEKGQRQREKFIRYGVFCIALALVSLSSKDNPSDPEMLIM
jgi:hypothetical protein